MFGGVKEGFKMGGKIGFWVGTFFTVEEAIDRVRGGRRDFLSTVVAGLGVAGGFSAWRKFFLMRHRGEGGGGGGVGWMIDADECAR